MTDETRCEYCYEYGANYIDFGGIQPAFVCTPCKRLIEEADDASPMQPTVVY